MTPFTFSRKVESILNDNAGRRVIGGQTSGALHAPRLSLSSAGNNRIFKRGILPKYHHYTVYIVQDCSGSMSRQIYSRCEPATKAHSLLRKGLEGAGAIVKSFGMNRTFFSLDHIFFLPEGEMIGKAEKLSWDCEKNTSAGTHDGYFLRQAGKNLLEENTPGKILLVLSDGIPGCDLYPCDLPGCGSREYLGDDLRKAVNFLRKKPLVLGALGIQTSALSRYWGTLAYEVKSPNEIFTQAAKILYSQIKRG